MARVLVSEKLNLFLKKYKFANSASAFQIKTQLPPSSNAYLCLINPLFLIILKIING